MVNEGIINLGNAKLISLDPNISISCSNDIKFLTSDTEKMRIDSSGNVGIGTNNPTRELDVIGDIRSGGTHYMLWNTNTGGTGSLNGGSSYGRVFVHSRIDTSISTKANSLLVINYGGDFGSGTRIDGNVGIGTDNPSGKLHITSSSYDDFIMLERSGVGTMGISATNPRGIQTTDGNGNFIGWHVKSDGNVGIGTTNPTEKLHINYTNNELKISDGNIIYGREENISRQSPLSTAETYYGSREHSIIRNANLNYRNTGDSGARYDTHKIVLGYSDTYDFGDNGYYPTYNAIKFQTVPGWDESATGGTTLNTNMIILSNGNVGINNNNPQNRLDIIQDNARTGTHRTGAAIYATSSSYDSHTGTIEVRHYNGTQGIGIGYNSLYATGSNSTQHINLIPRGSSGNVGINTTSPTSKLHVNGHAYISGSLKTDGNIYTTSISFTYYANGLHGGTSSAPVRYGVWSPNGRHVAQEFNATSDRRCKENIHDIKDETVERFMRLKAKTYHMKKDEFKETCIGFIAQDIIYESFNEETNELDDLFSIIKFHEEEDMMESIDSETGVNNPEGKCMNLNYNSCVPLLQRALQIEIEKNKLLEERLSKIETILKIDTQEPAQ